MMRVFNMGPTARVAAFPDAAGIHLVMVAGASKIAMNLATPTARTLHTELDRELPPDAPRTNRPAATFDRSPPPDWSRLVARLRDGRAIPSDAEHVAHLLHYLGVKTT